MRIQNLTRIFSAFLACAVVPIIAYAKADECPEEDPECEILKPTFLIVLDYSSSMLEDFQVGGDSRWKVAKDAIQNMLEHDDGFLEKNMHIGILRFGHQGAPELLEGNILDVPWYEEDDLATEPWHECSGDLINMTLDGISDPPPGAIGTWTNGALKKASELITEAKDLHPEDMDNRVYAALVITDGQWSGPDGNPGNRPPGENPALTAASLLGSDVKTYVVAITPDAAGLADANELADAGGTTKAFEADTPDELTDSLVDVVKKIQDSVVPHNCAGKLPRVMMILDASSSMTMDPETFMLATEEGQDLWDQGRFVLAGQTIDESGILTAEVPGFNGTFEDLSHIGVSTFNGDARMLVNYGPCMRDNVLWSLDPKTSCIEADGCMDAWGAPPRPYTYQGPGDPNYPDPPFVQETMSYAPPCLDAGFPGMCAPTGTRTDLGLKLAELNQEAYHEVTSNLNESSIYVTTDDTPYLNILITDGQYDPTVGPMVQSSLESMAMKGIKTYVIGVGNAALLPLIDEMAMWGGTDKAHSAESPEALEEALTTIVGGIEFDRCCKMNDCSQDPEPQGEEDDPPPEIPEVDLEESGSSTTTTTTSTSSSTTSSTSDTSGTTESDSGTTGGTDSSTEDSSTSSTSSSTSEDSSSTSGDTDGESTDSTSDSGDSDDAGDESSGDDNTASDAEADADVDGGENDADESDSGGDEGPGLGDESARVGCGCTTASKESGNSLISLGLLALGWGVRRRRSGHRSSAKRTT